MGEGSGLGSEILGGDRRGLVYGTELSNILDAGRGLRGRGKSIRR